MRASLSDLANEYEVSADNLTCMIRSLTKKKNEAKQKGDSAAEWRCASDLSDLYAQRVHVLEIAALLKNYYRNKEANTDEA